jgi:uncharacterized Zn finger protein
MARYGYGGDGYYGGWAPYVSVAERRRRAAKKMEALRKKGVDVQPITIEGRKIAKTFWGEAWCEHLESFSDFANRLPRGRTYVRNGSVCHLAIRKGEIEAKVSGSELYTVKIAIAELPAKKWKAIRSRCGGQIGSLIELLQGRLSDEVMAVVTDRKEGLFPLPGEIKLKCSCPDWATMCKHVAAVLYGVGARLDHKPELLFLLRGVNHEELIEADAERAVTAATKSRGKSKRLAAGALGEVFGITLDTGTATPAADGDQAATAEPSKPVKPAKPRAKKAAGKGAKTKQPAAAAPEPQPEKPAAGRARRRAAKPAATT